MQCDILILIVGVPLVPHSFPTRRSSDLESRSPLSATRIETGAAGETVKWNVLSAGRRSVRSEEHTSELQSRLHLVCRLLLETKNAECKATALCRRLDYRF